MAERNSPRTESFSVSSAEIKVYVSPLAPLDIPVSFFNAGGASIKIRFGGNTEYIPIAPGFGLTANPDPDVYATTDGPTSLLIVATGVSAFSSGVTSTGALSHAELQAIAATRSTKMLLAELLLEQRLTNEHLRRVTDEELKASDYPEWRLPG